MGKVKKRNLIWIYVKRNCKILLKGCKLRNLMISKLRIEEEILREKFC